MQVSEVVQLDRPVSIAVMGSCCAKTFHVVGSVNFFWDHLRRDGENDVYVCVTVSRPVRLETCFGRGALGGNETLRDRLTRDRKTGKR